MKIPDDARTRNAPIVTISLRLLLMGNGFGALKALSLNASIDTLQICGALEGKDVISARNAAINAKVIFQAGLENLDNLVENIIH